MLHISQVVTASATSNKNRLKYWSGRNSLNAFLKRLIKWCTYKPQYSCMDQLVLLPASTTTRQYYYPLVLLPASSTTSQYYYQLVLLPASSTTSQYYYQLVLLPVYHNTGWNGWSSLTAFLHEKAVRAEASSIRSSNYPSCYQHQGIMKSDLQPPQTK